MLVLEERYITQAEAARRAGVSRATIWGWLHSGRLTKHPREIDGRVYVDADELARKTRIRRTPDEGAK